MCEPATVAAVTATAAEASAASAAAATTAAATTAATTAAASSAAAASTAAASTAAASSAAAGMTTAQMVSLGLSAAGTAMSVVGMHNQSKTAKEIAGNNALTAGLQAADALRRGEKDAMEVQRRGAALKSAQQVSLAAKGLDLGYGTTADLQDQTDFFNQSDVATTRNNARKEAWAREAQAGNFQAEALSQRPWLAAGSTLLSGAGTVADRWYRYGSPNPRGV